MNFDYAYTKKRQEFGKPRRLIEGRPCVILDWTPNPKEEEEYIFLKNVDKSAQATSDFSAHSMNTEGKVCFIYILSNVTG